MTKEEANKQITAKVQEAYAALAEAERLADEYGLEFGFNPAYGMGGHYISKKAYEEEYEVSDAYEEQYGWNSSSSNCY